MSTVHISPAVSLRTTVGAFQQSIELREGDELIGNARWICSGDSSEGVVQILELNVSAGRGRRGNGRALMDHLTQQAKDYFKLHNIKLRRIWIVIEQKRQVIGRSFLMKFGFHHVGTVHEMLKDEDLLVYMRTFD